MRSVKNLARDRRLAAIYDLLCDPLLTGIDRLRAIGASRPMAIKELGELSDDE